MPLCKRCSRNDSQKAGFIPMKAVLGIDTSCYTTSAALVSIEGRLLSSERQLLTVEEGGRGLQQSAALFQHIKAIPQMIEAALFQAGAVQIVAVAASTRPRSKEDSYMPVFRAGESEARTAAMLLSVPFFPFSHQQGHIRAAMYGTELKTDQPFLALHLSGGTTELLAHSDNTLSFIGGTLDLHAGQLIDRIGVRMGLSFPAGPEMEKLAVQGHAKGLLGVTIRGLNCCISGAENKAAAWLSSNELDRQDIAAEVFDFLSRTVERMLEKAVAETGIRDALLAGGVSSSMLFRKMLKQRVKNRRLNCNLFFAKPELSGDNAVGVALLGADYLKGETNNGGDHN